MPTIDDIARDLQPMLDAYTGMTWSHQAVRQIAEFVIDKAGTAQPEADRDRLDDERFGLGGD